MYSTVYYEKDLKSSGIFKPHRMHLKNNANEIVIDSKNHVYVDGGVMDNYPIFLFDHTKYLEDASNQAESSIFNRQTLGFRLLAKEKIDYFNGETDPAVREISGILSYSQALFACIRNKENNDHLKGEDPKRSVYIDTVGVNTLDFNLTDEQKQKLVFSGQRAVSQYFGVTVASCADAGIFSSGQNASSQQAGTAQQASDTTNTKTLGSSRNCCVQ